MFTCSYCGVEKNDTEKREIPFVLKIGVVVGSLVLFKWPAKWPRNVCNECEPFVKFNGVPGLLLVVTGLIFGIAAFVRKLFHS
jgi:hypothetical protein